MKLDTLTAVFVATLLLAACNEKAPVAATAETATTAAISSPRQSRLLFMRSYSVPRPATRPNWTP